MAEFVRLEADGAVRHLVLTAGHRRNALDMPMLGEIAAAVAEVAADPEAASLVVSGEGASFCAGADVTSLFGDTNRPAAAIRADLKRVYASFLGIADLAIPTIAAVHGAAVGAGVNIAMACDVVVAAPTAKFVISFADIGLHPGGGCSWFLARRMGGHRAMATILGAETITGEQGYHDGLVTVLADDPAAESLVLAQRYAARDRALLLDMKRAVRMAATSDLAAVLEFESWAQAASVGRERFREYLDDFVARRP